MTLLQRLREAELDYTVTWGSGDLYGEAADRIEHLESVLRGAQLNKAVQGRAKEAGDFKSPAAPVGPPDSTTTK